MFVCLCASRRDSNLHVDAKSFFKLSNISVLHQLIVTRIKCSGWFWHHRGRNTRAERECFMQEAKQHSNGKHTCNVDDSLIEHCVVQYQLVCEVWSSLMSTAMIRIINYMPKTRVNICAGMSEQSTGIKFKIPALPHTQWLTFLLPPFPLSSLIMDRIISYHRNGLRNMRTVLCDDKISIVQKGGNISSNLKRPYARIG